MLRIILLIWAIWLLITIPIIEKSESPQTKLTQNVELQVELDQRNKLLSKIFNRNMTTFSTASINVTATAYSACAVECNSEPYWTANHTPSRIGLLAISADLEHDLGLQLDQLVLLPKYGLFKIADRMSTHKHKNTANPIPIRRTVDILHASAHAAKLFGIDPEIELIYILN